MFVPDKTGDEETLSPIFTSTRAQTRQVDENAFIIADALTGLGLR